MTEQNVCKAISCPYTDNFACHFYTSANACHLLPGEPQDELRSCGYFLYSTKADASRLRRQNDLYLSSSERYLEDVKKQESSGSPKFPKRRITSLEQAK